MKVVVVRRLFLFAVVSVLLALVFVVSKAHASIGFYVGKEHTEDGSVMLGGFGHEPSSHWLEVVPRQEHPEGATVEVGVTEDASIPGELIEIPQASVTNKYITSNYSEYSGFPPPLTNGGLNEHNVAARDIWSPSREELVEMTPEPQRGPNYSDLARIAMERASSAREAVEIVGGLIDEHGYSTYGGNSHLFADEDEGWVFINYAGGEGLWAAERLGPDDVRVSYPGYIQEFPTDFEDDPGYMASENLVDFAAEQGWWDPDSGETFDLQEVYGEPFPGEMRGDHEQPFRVPTSLEDELRGLGPVSLKDMLALVRDPRWSDDRSGYGQVAHLRPEVEDELGVLWAAVTGAVTTPYVPIHLGVEDVPPEYKQHRYMTKDADATFLDPEYAPLEGTRYATRSFKRLMYHTCENPEEFLPQVTSEIEALETEMLTEQAEVERTALEHYEAGDPEAAREYLTDNAEGRFLEALDLGERLANEVEAETRERFGIRLPEREAPEGSTVSPESQEMALSEDAEPARDRVNCYVEGLADYPREHGSMTGATEVEESAQPAPESIPDTGGLPWLGSSYAVVFALGIAGGALVTGLVWGVGKLARTRD